MLQWHFVVKSDKRVSMSTCWY